MSITPAPGYLLIEQYQKETKTESGLYIPGEAVEAPQKGSVVAIGEPEIHESGKTVGTIAKAGDVVIYKKWGGNEYKDKDKTYLFVKFEDILGLDQ